MLEVRASTYRLWERTQISQQQDVHVAQLPCPAVFPPLLDSPPALTGKAHGSQCSHMPPDAPARACQEGWDQWLTAEHLHRRDCRGLVPQLSLRGSLHLRGSTGRLRPLRDTVPVGLLRLPVRLPSPSHLVHGRLRSPQPNLVIPEAPP